ncbi:hypothetical protein BDU57DRAFT_534663 [Ampelomyces quisqualis]|uniref:Uncharacterized protein n=1 Tax=Ampelomyces quisqualis TaxID=50730 RepID=A0A6A5QZU6_AMPQU|nr:hypothetical protein BDU57DRAFT_534663 [Ampelomyces quisqualis]
MQKQISNARIAAARAQGQRVYISGIQGQHTLEVGVAYHYRGHYIYALPAGNPIEPVPFSTKKGVKVVGTVSSAAPNYDPRAPDLVPETSVAALKKSCDRVWAQQKEEEEERKQTVKQALEEEKEAAVLPPTALASTMPSISVHSAETHAPGGYASDSFFNAYTYTPHNRARFLADSAPGSRFGSATNTPYTSRPVSPSHPPLRSSGPFRQPYSTTNLTALLADTSNNYNALSDVAEGMADLQDATDSNSGIEYKLETNSDAEEYTYTYRHCPSPSTVESPPYSRNKPIGTGRPRRASMAMNQAYNASISSATSAPPPLFPALTQTSDASMLSAAAAAAPPPTTAQHRLTAPSTLATHQQSGQNFNRAVDRHSRNYSHATPPAEAASTARPAKCPLHGEDCDGVSTTETWRTQHARNTNGLRENYPVILGDGDRVMVDWKRILQEEKAALELGETRKLLR